MKKYYLIGLFVLLAGIFAYHFLAANQAEEQIDEAIQEQVHKTGARLSIQYSSIDVSPFRGNILFRDVTVVRDATIQRSTDVLLDLSYQDFLKIYFRGIQFGLKYLTEANISLIQPTQVNRNSLTEIKFDTLYLTYSGNAWDGLRRSLMDSTFKIDHNLEAKGTGFRFAKPSTKLGLLKSPKINFDVVIAKGTSLSMPGGSGNARLTTVTWTPPAAFQQNYAFFIKGIGFQPDSIPIQRADFSWKMEPSMPGIDLNSGEIITELCQINLTGNLITVPSFENPRLDAAAISVTNFSEPFARVIENMEKLFNISFPKQGDSLVFRLGGTLEKPVILSN